MSQGADPTAHLRYVRLSAGGKLHLLAPEGDRTLCGRPVPEKAKRSTQARPRDLCQLCARRTLPEGFYIDHSQKDGRSAWAVTDEQGRLLLALYQPDGGPFRGEALPALLLLLSKGRGKIFTDAPREIAEGIEWLLENLAQVRDPRPRIAKINRAKNPAHAPANRVRWLLEQIDWESKDDPERPPDS